MAHAHDDHADDFHPHVHVTPIPVYLAVFGALVGLTGLTVLAYNIHLGDANLAVAMLIATIKATLVCAFFMHLLHENRFNVLVALSAFVFAGVFVAYTMNDTEHRGRFQSIQGVWQDPATGELSPTTLDPSNDPFANNEEALVVIEGRRFENFAITHPPGSEAESHGHGHE